jgi:hypothetical protein
MIGVGHRKRCSKICSPKLSFPVVIETNNAAEVEYMDPDVGPLTCIDRVGCCDACGGPCVLHTNNAGVAATSGSSTAWVACRVIRPSWACRLCYQEASDGKSCVTVGSTCCAFLL